MSPTLAYAVVAGGGFLYLALFIPVLSVLAALLKDRRSSSRLTSLVDQLNLRDTPYYQIWKGVRPGPVLQQVWFPILITTLMCVYASALLVFSPEILDEPDRFTNIFLTGGDSGSTVGNGFTALCFAYLGWYCWAIYTIFSRLVTLELVAPTYYSLLTRLILAIVVSVAVQDLGILADTKYVPPATWVGFAAGLFPDSILVFLSRRLRKLFLQEDQASDNFALDLIQGVSTFRKFRLLELGIDNCANLASANPFTLYVSSNMTIAEVVDWIAQAQLLVLVGERLFPDMQRNGYRTCFDFVRGVASPALPRLAVITGYTTEQLQDLGHGVLDDPGFRRLDDLRARITPAPVPAAMLARHNLAPHPQPV